MSAEMLVQDQVLPAAVARHLEQQIASAQRLLDLVLRQGAAIRERDVEAVLARLSDIQVEMAARESLERERTELIRRAAVRLGVQPVEVGLPALAGLAAPAEQERLLTRSAELRGLLAEIAREHGINRALMRQELTFLDHLLRVSGEETQPGGRRLMDVEAWAMGVSTFMGLQTALRGLIAQQEALDVTGHNIANANTLGYSRQEVTTSASRALRINTGSSAGNGKAEMGTGVDVDGVNRARDRFLDLQYRAQAMRLGGLAARVQGLETIEGALAEPGETGISSQLQTFWKNWEGLGNDPEDPAARQAVIEAGNALATSLAELNRQLTGAAEVAEGEYAAITGAGGEVEQKAKEIALLNSAIRSAVTEGSQPNDLLDRRDLLLDELSELGQVAVTELEDGTIEVGFGDAAAPLVAGTEVNWPQELTEPKGKLGTLLELSRPGGTIGSFRAELNGVAEGLADAVNAIHTKGGGTAFFTYEAGKGAASLNVAVTAAEVLTASDGSAGGNDVAIAIGELQGGAVDRSYASFVTRVGTAMNEARNGETNAQALLTAVEERRESTSGVSLDEEMTNLQRFQRGYEASARAMTALDEALDVLINRTGRVGL